MDVFDRYREPVVAVEAVERAKVSRYGVIKGRRIDNGLYRVDDFVEKPAPAEAPSNLVIASRYVLTPEIFDYLEKTGRGKNNEIQLTDAMRAMVKERAMYALRFEGTRYDIGNKLDFIKTNLVFGLKQPDISRDLRTFVRTLARRKPA
jgi:UTP--glucose-1-phosphate uridylyltransferase